VIKSAPQRAMPTDPLQPLGPMPSPSPEGLDGARKAAISAQFAKIIQSKSFSNAERLRELLGFIAENYLKGNLGALKESNIGVEVFGKPPGFDSNVDSAVRTTAKRLRSKLSTYYYSEGRSDALLIELPQGHYIPRFTQRSPEGRHGVQVSPVRGSQWTSIAKRVTLIILSARAFSLLTKVFGALAVAGAAIVLAIVVGRAPSHSIAPHVQVGRALVRSTSEGRAPIRIILKYPAAFLALSPDGKKVFVTSGPPDGARTLTIVSVEKGAVLKTVMLPADSGSMAVSPDGKLYVGSLTEGIMIYDITRDELYPGVIPTHGSVLGMAITPDGKKLFLAMGQHGVRRLLVKTGKLKQITTEPCPQYLALDSFAQRLYVTYQCSGPGGRLGHDSIEVFDAQKEGRLGILSGLPMVGGDISVSTDGQLAMLDGWDACRQPAYDHVGCPVVPSHIYHLLRTSDRQILRSFALPVTTGSARFIDDSRFLVTGASVTVIDAASGGTRERWEHGLGDYAQAIVAPTARRVLIGGQDLLVLDVEDGECSPAQEGLVHLYSGDGTIEDAANVTELTPRGRVDFAPGRIGQAFFFSGTGGSSTGPKRVNMTSAPKIRRFLCT